MSKFTHLHLHTEYSLLDGTIKIANLVEKLKELGMDSCAITDHGVMYGAYKFYKSLKEAGIKPIIGCEVYVAPRDHNLKEAGIDNKYAHMILLAQNKTGYINLMKLVSAGHMEGYYYKPRVDIETLKKYSEGLVATSACLGGVVARHLMNGEDKKAEEMAKIFAEIYPGRFYIEIQRNGITEQDEVNPKLIEIARKLDLPLVATCDAHYLNQDDALVQEVLWCIADGKTLEDPTRRTYMSQELYVKSSEQIAQLFEDLPEAVENTQKIADSIEEYSLSFDRVEPRFLGLPKGETSASYLRKLAYEGAEKKYGKIDEELQKRIDYELEVINEKGYNDYFLVTREFVIFCRENGIVVGMRGSGCGSVVAYTTDITHLEPISWELYFERFLNPERNSPPDFDIDIADRRRDEVIQFAIDRYGIDSVKQIGTFSKLQTRQAIRDVSRVLGVDLAVADQLSKMVEIVFGKAKDIDYMIENNKEFAQIVESDPLNKRMADIVRRIAGLCRGVSTHACGIIITPDEVSNYVPLQRDSKGEGIGMTQFEMFDLEEVGVMKFDFLGLRNLGVIGDSVEKIKGSTGEELDLMSVDANDPDTYKLIQSGHTVGIFQLESEGMRKTIRGLKPETQEEICYLLAAYRPGPMQFIPEYVEVKEGKKEAEYLMPELEPILSITNGVITYQEQVIRIAVDIAGYTMGGADMLRKAMGKKKMDVMEQEKPKFIGGAVEKGFKQESVDQLWERLLQFANYGFNKAHSASYALVSYWTAYLKAHYPLEFMAALLEGDLDTFDRVVIDLQECERLGIQVLPPDVNKSDHKFTIDGKNIRFGMAAIKNVGEDVVKVIVEERAKNGEYRNFDDFVYRNIDNKVQKRVVEYMIMAGALDSLGDRQQLIAALPLVYDRYKHEKTSQKLGQIDIFSSGPAEVQMVHIDHPMQLPEGEPTPVYQKLEWEKELLGIYVSSHPLDDLHEFFASKGAIPISELLQKEAGRKIYVVGGIASNVKRITTKKGDPMAFVTVEDKSASIEMVVFPSAFEEVKDELLPNKPMLFAGRLNDRDGDKSFMLEKAKVVNAAAHGTNFSGVTFKINGVHTEDDVVELKKFIKDHPGNVPVRIIMVNDGESHVMNLENKIAVNDEAKQLISRFS
ncbi:MAG: DNA polymerase III subunit alpha [Candidatus Dojkabacteria bacterium]|nr:MAG: DNA polymerase III subunit alpha [Candidatus Dojkabacteria bacterium]